MEHNYACSLLRILQNLVNSFAQPEPTAGSDVAAFRLRDLFRLDSSVVTNLRHSFQDLRYAKTLAAPAIVKENQTRGADSAPRVLFLTTDS